MSLHTVEDLDREKTSHSPHVGRRLDDLVAKGKPAPRKNTIAETRKAMRKIAAKKRKSVAKRRGFVYGSIRLDHEQGDEDCEPSVYNDVSSSDESGEMSVDSDEMEDGVKEKIIEDGSVIRTRGSTTDYSLVEKKVKESASFAQAGAYYKQQWKSLLSEMKANADGEVDDPDIPIVDCDLQGPNDDIDASFGLTRGPDETQEEFLACLTPDFIYREGNRVYELARNKSTYLLPYNGKDGAVEWKPVTSVGFTIYGDGSVALRRRHNKRKRTDAKGEGQAK